MGHVSRIVELSIRSPINDWVENVVINHGATFKAISNAILQVVLLVESVLRGLPWWAVIIVFMALAWASTRKIVFSAIVGVMMVAVGVLGLWDLTMQTLALMLVATLVSVLIGLPIGILCAKNRVARTITLPVLDLMQTIPSFVYLIPAAMLFGLGKVPAILATVIYADAAADPPHRPRHPPGRPRGGRGEPRLRRRPAGRC